MLDDSALQTLDALLQEPFGHLPDLIRFHARYAPSRTALIDPSGELSYGELERLSARIAASLQRDGVQPGDSVAVCAANSINYAAIFIGALRAGAAVAPLAPATSPEALQLMLANAGARIFFVDNTDNAPLAAAAAESIQRVSLGQGLPYQSFDDWLLPEGAQPRDVAGDPERTFNIIYSSGTTGTPKGIVHSSAMRWRQISAAALTHYRPDAVTLVSTPLYSNTTLVSFLPSIGGGAKVVLMPKFSTTGFLELAQKHRATHAMLVPVQYKRLMETPGFDEYDLSSFRMKFCTSAPFAPALKAEVLRRWPGGLIEYYGMTEGGGSCHLICHEHPDKLHSVGKPAPGHDIRIIDPEGKELPPGQIGEIVGRSPAMMQGYHKEPGKSAQAEWYDAEGNRFIRTGDVGRFDEDGFLYLMDRVKDMIISGGFNIYPSDLEAVLMQHEAVSEAAVFGIPSETWGETPAAAVVLRAGHQISGEDLREWANARLGKTQRLHSVTIVEELPRNHLGKVSKKDLRDAYRTTA